MSKFLFFFWNAKFTPILFLSESDLIIQAAEESKKFVKSVSLREGSRPYKIDPTIQQKHKFVKETDEIFNKTTDHFNVEFNETSYGG